MATKKKKLPDFPAPMKGVDIDKVTPKREKVKIFVATPMYGGQCYGTYVQSIMTMAEHLRAAGIDVVFSFMFNESLITRARNALTHTFLKTDCTHLMFIDSDIRFSGQDVVPMVESKKDIICGIYPKKEINWATVQQAMNAGVPFEELKHHTGSFVVNLKGYTDTVTVAIDKPCEIWNGGTGFMLIKRNVFKKLAKTVPTYTNDVLDLNKQIEREVIHEYFATSIEPETNRLLSEDYHFCRIARLSGIKVWAAPWVNLAHTGSYVFEGQLLRTP